jgi:hypothetical protein
MEVETKGCVFTFIVLDHTLENADVEWDMSSTDGQQDGVVLVIDVDELRLEILWQIILALVALDFAALNGLLLLKVTIEVLIASLLQLFQLFMLQNVLMLVSLLLVLQLLISCLLNLASPALNNVACVYMKTQLLAICLGADFCFFPSSSSSKE